MSQIEFWFRKRILERWNEHRIKNGEEPFVISDLLYTDEFAEGLYPQPSFRDEVQSVISALEHNRVRIEALTETLREYSELKERVRLNNEKLKSGLSNN